MQAIQAAEMRPTARPPGMYYKVLYEGINPKTKKAWRAAWVHASGVTEPAKDEWKALMTGGTSAKPAAKGKSASKSAIVLSDDEDGTVVPGTQNLS